MAAVSRDLPMSIAKQCRLAGVSRMTAYRPAAKRTSDADLALMRRIDELHTAHPFYGARQITASLRLAGERTGRNRVRRLMRIMGVSAVAPKPRTSAGAPHPRVFPYLLRDVAVTEPDQAWCADITYIPMRRGFMYLVAVMDWATRFVLSWRLSNSMDAGFCLDALHDALSGGRTPGVFNTDQGSQFTSAAFTGAVQASGAQVSMDGRGRWIDNRLIERLWRSLKCEAVHLHALADGLEAHRVIGSWMAFYNDVRPHSSLGGVAPRMAYEGGAMPLSKAA